MRKWRRKKGRKEGKGIGWKEGRRRKKKRSVDA
jgi:hypothetical protein